MKRFQILGHDNCALSLLLETIYCCHGTSVSVDIFSNIPEDQNRYSDVPFRIEGLNIQERSGSDWKQTSDAEIFLGAMAPPTRRIIFDWFATRSELRLEDLANAIHPTATVARQAMLGRGIHLSPQVTVSPFAEVGHGALLNRNASVGHHSRLENWVNLNPGSTVGGFCHIGSGVTIGIGATVLDRISIGNGSMIGAGSLVTRNIPPGVVAYGAPAKTIRLMDKQLEIFN